MVQVQESTSGVQERQREPSPQDIQEPQPEPDVQEEPLQPDIEETLQPEEPELLQPEPEQEPEPESQEITQHQPEAETRPQAQDVEVPPEPVSRPDKGKRPDRAERSAQDQPATASTEPSQESQPKKKRRGRPRKSTDRPEPEPEPEPSRDSTDRPTKRKGRPPKKTRPASPAEESEEEAEQEEEEEAEAGEGRRGGGGDTVPVTVHRLANLESLQSINIDTQAYNSDSSESADELSTRQRTKKHPHRGGVNQADVLSQICRETLEKTLTTLKNGIANETNAARRAEWTRKKKAVEMFGTELEGRLFEMSEMLDSNFVLGVKLRRAKREMLEMRSRLYHVRREREEVAVRMDDVRRRFADEEAVRIVSFFLFSGLLGV